MLRPIVLAMTVLFPLLSWGQSISLPVEEVKKEAKPPEKSSEQTPDETAAAQKKGGELVEVTGSHIRRIDVEGPAPILSISRKEIEKTGYNSISDVLRNTTINSFGSAREASGSSSAGNAEIDLRGLGSTNTLVLLDGQRLPTDAVTGAVDLNLIPMAAVERIEVLKDGASAIYGSDALGGVVNIITRKDFKGTQMTFTQVTPELKGGRKTDLSLVNGINGKHFNMVNVVQYRDNAKIFQRDRSWENNGTNEYSDPPSYASDEDGAQWHAAKNCPADRIEHTADGDYCTFKYSDYATDLPAMQQFSVLSQSNFELSSRVKMMARVGGTQKNTQWSYAPAVGNFTIPWSVASHLGPAGGPLDGATPGKDVNIQYRTKDLGARDSQIKTTGVNALLGTTVSVTSDWSMDVNAAFNSVSTVDRGINGYALKNKIRDAIATGTCNPFADGSKAACYDSSRYVTQERMRSLLSSGEVKASGPLAEMPAGPLSLAVGSGYTYQSYEDSFDDHSVAKEVFGGAGSSGGGRREIVAGFLELGIPVTKRLEFQIADRFDHYSDVGSTQNPKGAILYRATDKVLLRSSVGTGFKAPLMQDLYAATSDGNPTFIDKTKCAAERAAGGLTTSCEPSQHNVISSGNTGLRPEKSISYTAGAVYQPTPDLNFGTDFFLTKSRNVVNIDLDDVMDAEQRYGSDYVASHGVIIERDGNGAIKHITAPLQNLSKREVFGLDLQTSYRISKFKISSDHSQTIYFKEQGFPGVPDRNKLGERGRPRWRNSTGVTYNPGERHDITVSAQTTAGQRKTVEGTGSLRDFTTWDLQYSYDAKTLGMFTVGVRNILGETPPLDDSNPGSQLDSGLYDQVGRSAFTTYRATF